MNALAVPSINQQVTVPVEVINRRDALLAASALIPDEVVDQAANDRAVAVAADLKAFTAEIEKARKAVKEPVLDLGRAIDAKAKEVSAPAVEELNRIIAATANYQTAQLERIREQERKRQEEERRLEQERLAALRKIEEERLAAEAAAHAKAVEEAMAAKSAADLEAAQQRAKEEAERIAREAEARAKAEQERAAQSVMMLPQVKTATAAGQTAKIEWDWEVTDIHTLARMHPGLVKIEPCRREINEAIEKQQRNGQNPPRVTGLRIFETTKVNVRASRPGKVIQA